MTSYNRQGGFLDRVAFSPKDMPLKDDVGTLGSLLGEILVEQGGPELFERVEDARRAALRRRQGKAGVELTSLLGELDPEEATSVVRAFSAYFGLVNMAEQVHRIRRRRDYLRDEGNPQPGSLLAVVQSLAARGLGPADVTRLLGHIAVDLVFTAHPTEAVRRTLLRKEQRIARALVDRLDPGSLLPREERAALARIRNEVTVAWQTEEHVQVRPQVSDEVERILFYLVEVIYSVIPALYENLESALIRIYGPKAGGALPCPLVRFASWVGGDMDGNPNAGPLTIAASLARHRVLCLRRYQVDLATLFDRLSQSASKVGASTQVLARTATYQDLMPEAYAGISPRYHDMPYRVLLAMISARLQATEADASHGYPNAASLLDDLREIEASLLANHGAHAGSYRVRRLIRRVETFGFHLATLDIRQDARVHRRVAGRLLGIADFAELPRAERTRKLLDALNGNDIPVDARGDAEATRMLEVMATIGKARKCYGADAIGPYIISMARGPDDALAVLLLARAGGLASEDGRIPLDIAPLFETVGDLATSGATLRDLLALPLYRRHLDARGGRQVVMLGYSDSGKDSGIAAARWALHSAQTDLARSALQAGVELTLFHGRGGTISRGGGKPRDAILAQPPGSCTGRLRVTEQGEIIHAKYGLRDIALRTLELTLGAVLEAGAVAPKALAPGSPARSAPTAPVHDDTVHEDAVRSKIATLLAKTSRATWRSLIYEDPDFLPYFRSATPIDVIERLQIGSRPPSRGTKGGIGDLRAIPWVFAWTQSRHVLPGWYGTGAGLQRAIDELGMEELARMLKCWPFLANLVSDVEMVLAKADMEISARYAALAGVAGTKIFPKIQGAFEQTRDLICELASYGARGRADILDRDPTLQRAIRLRNPYIDPMSMLQVELLGRWRAGGRRDDALLRSLFTTVKGIARGMQNTG